MMENVNKDNVIKLLPKPQRGRLECPQCGCHTEAKCDCGVPYIYKRAGEIAAEAIKDNPEMSDRAIAAEIGVSHPTVAKARKATGKNLPVEKRVGKDGKKRKMPVLRKTTIRAIPNGYSSLSEAVLAGIDVEKSGGSQAEAREKSGLSHYVYAEGREIVLLAQRVDLSPDDSELAKDALKQMDSGCEIHPLFLSVRPIGDKLWGRKGRRLVADKKRMESFNSALSYLLTVCTSASRITLPYLSEGHRLSAMNNIKEAKQALDVLQRRIRNGESEYHE